MITVAYIVLYVLAGVITGKLMANKVLMRHFQIHMIRARKAKPYWAKDMAENEYELQLHKRSLSDAMKDSEMGRELGATLAGVFMPIGLTVLVGWYLYDLVCKLVKFNHLSLLPSKAERRINKMENEIEAERDRIDRINKLIADGKTLGLSQDAIASLESMK